MVRTEKFNAVLHLKIRNQGTRDEEITAELFVDGDSKLRIQQIILSTELEAVSIKER